MQIIKPIPKPEDIEIELISKCKHKKTCFFYCQYPLPTCDYISYEGKPRGCSISECDKYISEKDAKAMGKKKLTEEFTRNPWAGGY